MKTLQVFVVALGAAWWVGAARAETVGSVEPEANEAVVEIGPLAAQDLDIRAAFAERLLQCGIVDQVERVLRAERAVSTINERNTHFQVAAGGFAGTTSPTYAYRVIDSGPNAASHADILVLTDSLSYVMSQGSAFLLDADNAISFDFPANYVVLKFSRAPAIEESAELFETVGRIDPELFETDSSGYTQLGRSYLALQSAVPDEQFIAGYVQAAQEFGVEYTPVVDGKPSLFQGGAAFPGNDWIVHPHGQEYLDRLPVRVHEALGRIRGFHLSFTRRVLRKIRSHDADHRAVLHFVKHLDCQ